jgi:hypothetical protein
VPDPEQLSNLAKGHLAYLEAVGGGAARVVDKMPDNLFHLGVVALLFPSARIVFCRRNGLDTSLSNFFQIYTSGNSFSYDLADCGRRFRESERLADHWLKALNIPTLNVYYEALVDDLEGESRRLIDFLGLDWEPACLSFHETKRMVNTASSWQVRQRLYTSSVGRWLHYRDHLRPLYAALGMTDPAM